MAQDNRGGLVGNLPTAVKLAAIGLLIHQLMKHRPAATAEAPPQPAPRQPGPWGNAPQANAPPAGDQGGGLGSILGGLFGGGSPGGAPAGGSAGGTTGGGLLGGILGGLLGGAATGALGGAASRGSHAGGQGGDLGGLLGGLGGLLGGLRQQGLGEEVDSWIRSGPNREASPGKLAPAFDPEEIEEAARRAGTDRGTLMDAMSKVLPEMVDRMTPQGRVSPSDVQGGDFDDLLRSMGMGGGGRR